MSSFPTNARTGQTHKKFGRKYAYSETTGTWAPVVPLASVAEVRKAEATATSATQFYALATDLPLSGNTAGSMAFVQETNRLYLWSGTGWYNVATISGAAASVSGANTSYEFASDGTPIVITLSQTGLTSPTWSYQVTSGSLGRTATVTQADNVFTITPSINKNHLGSFSITFTATDGSNTLVTSSSFTLEFAGDWSAATLLHTLENPNAVSTPDYDQFGWAAAAYGNYAIISARLEDDVLTPTNNSGKAYIFELSSGTLLHTLDNPNAYDTAGNDNFGLAVDIGQNYAIVGTSAEDDAGGTGSGKAYIFDIATGALVATLDNPNSYGTTASDGFATSVAISGNYCACGTWREENPSGESNSGVVYIFKTTTGDWSDITLLHTIQNPNSYSTAASDQFGSNIAMSTDYLVVGVQGEDSAAGATSGVVYVFNIITGVLAVTLDNPNITGTALNDSFGWDVDISGNHLITAASQEDVGGTNAGVAYIYKTTTGDWTDATLLHTIYNPVVTTSDYFGRKVAIDGDYAAISAPTADVPVDSGRVYVFEVSTGTLLKTIENPTAYGSANNDEFGDTLCMSGDYIIAGSKLEQGPSSATQSGIMYVFQAG